MKYISWWIKNRMRCFFAGHQYDPWGPLDWYDGDEAPKLEARECDRCGCWNERKVSPARGRFYMSLPEAERGC